MNNQFNIIWVDWKMQNLDNAHYYQMGTWSELQSAKPGLFARLLEAIRNELIIIRCHLDTMIKPVNVMADQQCRCTEA